METNKSGMYQDDGHLLAVLRENILKSGYIVTHPSAPSDGINHVYVYLTQPSDPETFKVDEKVRDKVDEKALAEEIQPLDQSEDEKGSSLSSLLDDINISPVKRSGSIRGRDDISTSNFGTSIPSNSTSPNKIPDSYSDTVGHRGGFGKRPFSPDVHSELSQRLSP